MRSVFECLGGIVLLLAVFSAKMLSTRVEEMEAILRDALRSDFLDDWHNAHCPGRRPSYGKCSCWRSRAYNIIVSGMR